MPRTPSIARLGPLLLATLSSPARGRCSRELFPAGLQNGDRFGYAVATSGDLAAVIATYAGTQGEVAVHRVPTGEQLGAIAWWDVPGAVDLDGTVLAVGMLGQTLTYGQAALFDAATGTLLGALSSSGSTLGDFFGSAIALAGDHVLVGAPVDPLGGWPGAAYVFDTTTRAQRFELTPSDGAPWNGLHQLGLFLVGDAPDLVHGPGGSQGDLCVGADVRRYFDQVQSTGPDGTLALQVDLARLPGGGAVQAGETWHFQAWYRDHATSNFTPAAAVTFP